MSRITVRIDDELKQEFADHCDDRGTSMSARIKDLIRSDVGTTTDGKLPDDPLLATAYQTLYWMTTSGAVEIDDAESTLANDLNIPKSAIRSRVCRPLRNRGYLTRQMQLHRVVYRLNVEIADEDDDVGSTDTRALESADERLNELDDAEVAA